MLGLLVLLSDSNAEDRVRARAVLVHVSGADFPVVLAFRQASHDLLRACYKSFCHSLCRGEGRGEGGSSVYF